MAAVAAVTLVIFLSVPTHSEEMRLLPGFSVASRLVSREVGALSKPVLRQQVTVR